jgi:hypothetical protein
MVRQAGHVAGMRNIINAFWISVGKRKQRFSLRNLDINGRQILNWFLRKQVLKNWFDSVRSGQCTLAEPCEHGNESLRHINMTDS